MGYWLKSFNAKPPPVPGTTYTVPQINNCKFTLTCWNQVFHFNGSVTDTRHAIISA